MASVGVPDFTAMAIAIKAFIKLCFPGNPKRKSFKIPSGVLHQNITPLSILTFTALYMHPHLPQR
jgi:hypothetical protein